MYSWYERYSRHLNFVPFEFLKRNRCPDSQDQIINHYALLSATTSSSMIESMSYWSDKNFCIRIIPGTCTSTRTTWTPRFQVSYINSHIPTPFIYATLYSEAASKPALENEGDKLIY